MQPVDQTTFGAPMGNCMQACLASLLEVPLGSAPAAWVGDNSGFNEDLDNWHPRLNAMLSQWGLSYVEMEASSVLCLGGAQHCVLVGDSPRGDFWHAVVGLVHPGGHVDVLHDPHPSREGIRTLERIGFLATL